LTSTIKSALALAGPMQTEQQQVAAHLLGCLFITLPVDEWAG
jgi:hypothetical protein